MLGYFTSERIDCAAFRLQYIGGTYQLAQTVWGEPKLIHSLQPGRRWKRVCEFVYIMLLSLLQTPI